MSNFNHDYYFALCDNIGSFSKCYSRKAGAVIVQGDIVVPGYNGPPRGVPHCETRRFENEQNDHGCPRRRLDFPSGEGLHLCIATHAEVNAIVNCARHGISTLGARLYTNTPFPCKNCMGVIINAGIVEVVWDSSQPLYPDYALSSELALCSNVRSTPANRG